CPLKTLWYCPPRVSVTNRLVLNSICRIFLRISRGIMGRLSADSQPAGSTTCNRHMLAGASRVRSSSAWRDASKQTQRLNMLRYRQLIENLLHDGFARLFLRFG